MSTHHVENYELKLDMLLQKLQSEKILIRLSDKQNPVSAEETCEALNNALDGFVLDPIITVNVNRSLDTLISGGRTLYALFRAFDNQAIPGSDSTTNRIIVGFDLSDGKFHPGEHDFPPEAAFKTVKFMQVTRNSRFSQSDIEKIDQACLALRNARYGIRAYHTNDPQKAERYIELLDERYSKR